MVAATLEALELRGGEKVLEIGAGSGYLTALLGRLAGSVRAIERVPELSVKARERLDSFGLTNYMLWTADGTYGWPEEAPFERHRQRGVGDSRSGSVDRATRPRRPHRHAPGGGGEADPRAMPRRQDGRNRRARGVDELRFRETGRKIRLGDAIRGCGIRRFRRLVSGRSAAW